MKARLGPALSAAKRIMCAAKSRCVVLAACILIAGAGAIHAISISVVDSSFEDPLLTAVEGWGVGTSPAPWHNGPGWSGGQYNVGPGSDYSDWVAARPDGGNQLIGLVSGGLYQTLGVNLQANTTYTLTVDVGARKGFGFGTAAIGLGYGGLGSYGSNLLTAATTSEPTPAAESWALWQKTFVTGASPAGLGESLRIDLGGSYVALLDNVRLDAVGPPPPAGWLPNLSRGHNILLQRGLQIQALTSPEFDHPTQQFNSARWTESNFTTAHFWANNYPVGQMPGPPGIPWGLTDYNNSSDISSAGYPYASSLVSYEFKDEQDITAPGEQAYLKSAMASFHVNRPNVITYTNQWGSQVSAAAMQNYMLEVQPDMLCFDTYPFNGNVTGGSPTGFYGDMQKYRKLGLAGNDGTGTQPIPVGLYTQTFTYDGVNNHIVSESEIRLNNYSAWAFGYKFVDSFMYDPNHYGSEAGNFAPILFYGNDASSPTPQFYQVAETNRQSRNLGPALVRLVSTDVRMKMGQHKEWGVLNVGNDLPSDVSSWDSSAGPYITDISVTNLGGKNNSLEGDLIVGYFKPLDGSFTNAGHENDTYFMIVNGLSDATGLAADTRQLIHLDFNFGSSGIDSLLRLSRETGLVETVGLVHTSGSLYYLDLYLDGGTGDLFKFNNGGTFVPEPGTMCLLGIGFGVLAIWRLRRRQERYEEQPFTLRCHDAIGSGFSDIITQEIENR